MSGRMVQKAVFQTNFFDALRVNFAQAIPHTRECGMVVDALDADGARARMPFRPEWLGDTERGVYHTGIITTLVDTASGVAAMAAAGRFETIATLDLRMDFLRPAAQGKDLHVEEGGVGHARPQQRKVALLAGGAARGSELDHFCPGTEPRMKVDWLTATGSRSSSCQALARTKAIERVRR